MERFTTAPILFILLLFAGCGATEDPEDPPRLVVAYVDETGDVVIRGEPDGRSWRFTSDGVVFGMSWSPNAEQLLITERLGDDWQLRLIETAGFTVGGRVPLVDRPGPGVTWRHDGAAFVPSGFDSAAAFSRTGRLMWSVHGPSSPIGWSPDGRWFAFGGTATSSDRVRVTDGTVTHELTGADLGLTDGFSLSATSWLIDGTMSFVSSSFDGTAFSTRVDAWRLAVSDDGLQLGQPVDPKLAVEHRLASEAKGASGEAARDALVASVGGDTVASGDIGGFRWVSARYDDDQGTTGSSPGEMGRRSTRSGSPSISAR